MKNQIVLIVYETTYTYQASSGKWSDDDTTYDIEYTNLPFELTWSGATLGAPSTTGHTVETPVRQHLMSQIRLPEERLWLQE